MNRAELERRTKAITSMLKLFNASGDDDLVTIYVTTLKDVPVDLLEKACKKLMMESEQRPLPATVLKVATNIADQVSGTDTLPFAEAWKEITKELHDTFVYGTPKFSRPEIKQTVDAFGWNELCEMKTSEVPIIRAQLKSMYEAICERNKEKKMNAYVLGNAVLIESGNGVRLMLK